MCLQEESEYFIDDSEPMEIDQNEILDTSEMKRDDKFWELSKFLEKTDEELFEKGIEIPKHIQDSRKFKKREVA